MKRKLYGNTAVVEAVDVMLSIVVLTEGISGVAIGRGEKRGEGGGRPPPRLLNVKLVTTYINEVAYELSIDTNIDDLG